jgi:hypothetical protein
MSKNNAKISGVQRIFVTLEKKTPLFSKSCPKQKKSIPLKKLL